MVFYLIILFDNQLNKHDLIMSSQSLGLCFLEGPQKIGIQTFNNFHLFLFQWKLKVIHFEMQWINMIYIEEGSWVLFGQI